MGCDDLPLRELDFSIQNLKERPSRVYHTTGFTRSEFNELVALVFERFPTYHKRLGRPRSIGFRVAVAMTLHWMRRNVLQAELAEIYGGTQSTVSEVLGLFQPILQDLTSSFIPDSVELDSRNVYVLDGTLLPCWAWKDHPENYSGKHKKTGHTVQVACTLSGRLSWVSIDRPGSFHDMRSVKESGFLNNVNPLNVFADKGYIGSGAVTPVRKSHGETLNSHQKIWNHSVNSVRYRIEQTIAHLKTWRILHTPYRGPHQKYSDVIDTVIGLEFYRLSFR